MTKFTPIRETKGENGSELTYADPSAKYNATLQYKVSWRSVLRWEGDPRASSA